jgi:hypothetical protein
MGFPELITLQKIGGEYSKNWRMLRKNEESDENCTDLLDLSQMLCYYY